MSRSLARIFGTLIAAVVIFFVGWWAARATLTPSTQTQPESAVLTVEAREGTVGRTFNFSVNITTPSLPVAINPLEGVITRVGDTEVDNGSVLFVVGDQGVIAVESALPFYRDLGMGDRGDDVKALQTTLHRTGHLASAPDGVFGNETLQALARFQRDRGLAQATTAPLGTLYAFASLPTTVSFDESLRPSAVVSAGQALVNAPRVSVNLLSRLPKLNRSSFLPGPRSPSRSARKNS